MTVPASDLATVAMATSLVNNTDELLKSMVALAAGTYTFGPFYNPKEALRIALNVAAIGGGTITLTLLGYDNSSNATWSILVGTAVAAPGLTRMEVGPLIAASANAIAQDYAPVFYEVQAVIVTGPVTGTIGAHGIGA